jgi:hypothetical protein
VVRFLGEGLVLPLGLRELPLVVELGGAEVLDLGLGGDGGVGPSGGVGAGGPLPLLLRDPAVGRGRPVPKPTRPWSKYKMVSP